MALLRAVEPARVSASFRLGWPSAREVASMPEESYDKASPSHGRKSRLRADCCNTTAPQAISAPQDLIEFLHFFMQDGCPFEVRLLTGSLALLLHRRPQRSPAGIEKLHESPHFHVVFFWRAAGKARRQAHFHFGVEAARKHRIAAD